MEADCREMDCQKTHQLLAEANRPLADCQKARHGAEEPACVAAHSWWPVRMVQELEKKFQVPEATPLGWSPVVKPKWILWSSGLTLTTRVSPSSNEDLLLQ